METLTRPIPKAASGSENPGPDEVILIVNEVQLFGWQEIRITAGAERVPRDFDIQVTEKFPGNASIAFIKPGDTMTLMIGKDPVITGYCDRYSAQIDARGHTVRIQGRGKCEDLVDCSAEITSMNTAAASVSQLARVLAAKFGVTVSAITDPVMQVQQFAANLGESSMEIIERVTRWAGLLTYEDAAGNLILAEVGATMMASGVSMPGNIETASRTLSMDERFSEVTVVLNTTDNLDQIEGATPTLATTVASANMIWTEKDLRVPRYRPHIIVAEQGIMGLDNAKRRARNEVARRYGRSVQVRVGLSTWRDNAGTLWEPNAELPSVSIPALKVTGKGITWIIAEVTFLRGEGGTKAELLLMPKEGLMPEPLLLTMVDAQVAAATRNEFQPGVGGGAQP